MYVVKVGEYYVKKHDVGLTNNGMYITDIILSKEIMREYTKEFASFLANKINGEVIEITEEVTND